ncbi:MAG: hypothetical protein AAGC88_09485, partial [Bacteroidota bacterium]
AELVMAAIKETARFSEPTKKLNIILDEPDNRFLELSVFTSADYLVTGNWKNFRMSSVGHTVIVNPADYWDKYKPEI